VNPRLAQPQVDAGALLHILPDTVGRVERVSAVYPDRTYLDPKVRAFVDQLAAYFRG
jgi:DNA-binding transcriptional LysR family regulator